jgi:hypothetical protein
MTIRERALARARYAVGGASFNVLSFAQIVKGAGEA